MDSDHGDNRNDDPAVVKVSAGDVSYYVNDPKGNTFEGQFVDASSMDPFAPAIGNYVVFRGLTLDELEIRLKGDESLGRHADGRPSIAGIQIVSGADRENVIDEARAESGVTLTGMWRWGTTGSPGYTAGWSTRRLPRIISTAMPTSRPMRFGPGRCGSYHRRERARPDFGEAGDDLILGDNARLVLFDGEIISLNPKDCGHGNCFGHYDYHDHDDRQTTAAMISITIMIRILILMGSWASSF
jgi:hypothetical protein